MTPEGGIDSVAGGVGTISVTGWAVDRSTSGSVGVRVTAGSIKRVLYTHIPRPDIAAHFGGNGLAGFAGSLSGVPPGMQDVCAMVYSALGSANNRSLGCRFALVADPTGKSPVGQIISVDVSPGRIHLTGWGLDPESSDAIGADVKVDDKSRASTSAGLRSTKIPGSYAGLGKSHGFELTVPAISAGFHKVCVRGRNVGDGGVDTLVDCLFVNVPAHDPGGVLETAVSTRPGKVDISGWALDLETSAPISVLLVVDGRWYVVPADRRRSDIASRYPGYGSSHGFAATVNATGGPRDVCAYGLNVAGGSNRLIGCRTVDVVK
jgi:hypothetical protein